MGLFSKFFGREQELNSLDDTPVISIDDIERMAYTGQQFVAPPVNSLYTGEKFFGGFGSTASYNVDYYTLRERSRQVFTDNLYAQGLIDRLVTNEINTGLCPEATPVESILKVKRDSLNEWTENVENLFQLWAENPEVCDWKKVDPFGVIQLKARRESLIAGDILVILRQSAATKMPMVQIISGDKVVTPAVSLDGSTVREGNEIKHGVEIDPRGRHVAYWVRQDNGDINRIPVWGEKSGRKIAWLVYGTPKLIHDVRGMPLLSIILQSVKELDRYRDSAQRKAAINSMIAFFIKREQDKMSSLPVQGAAVRKDKAVVTDNAGGAPRELNVNRLLPGVSFDRLAPGEIPEAFRSEVDVDFGKFEEVIASGMAWATGIPPEIYRLMFSNNYSASQAAINEFKMKINMVWYQFGKAFCTPIYTECFISWVLIGKLEAKGFLEAWADPMKWDIYGAWISCEWYGSIKPSTDMLKQANASKELIANGWSTNAREARVLTGTKYSKNIARLKQENEQKAEALKPLLALQPLTNTADRSTPSTQAVRDMIEEAINELQGVGV